MCSKIILFEDWQYGYADTVDYIKKVDADYDKIVVSNKQPLDDSYMFFYFISNIRPKNINVSLFPNQADMIYDIASVNLNSGLCTGIQK